jgi:hypothetical protein
MSIRLCQMPSLFAKRWQSLCLAVVVLCLVCWQVACTSRDTCQHTCTPNERRCDQNGGQLLVCAQNAGTLCFAWNVTPCAKGCLTVQGQAACGTDGEPVCNDACTVGQARCQANAVQTCELPGAGKCPTWGATYPCPTGQYCVKGSCSTTPPPACQDTCQQGSTECVGNAVRSCMQSAQGCWEWSEATACLAPKGICQQGQCIEDKQCSVNCTPGTKQCNGNKVQFCRENAQTGCPVWSEPLYCAEGKSCQGGSCQPNP